MDKLDYLKRLYNYNHWANKESARVATAISSERERAFRILSHIIGAERLWLERLHGDPQTTAVWPELEMASVPQLLDDLHDQWMRFLDNQREDKLLRPIPYKNSKGHPWASRVEEILTHVVLHSSYHRGQLALLTREADIEPPLTDFIHAIRSGLVE
jgi:uncharacterized damage-inducible protein DinB